MNIQYNHKRRYAYTANTDDNQCYDVFNPRGGETIALEVAPAWLLETLEVGAFFEKKVGKARCSNEDNYNKKTGRELATSRMKAVRLTCVSNILFNGDRITQLQDPTGNIYILKKADNHTQPHFIDYE